MFQRFATPRSSTVTAADTAAHAFVAGPVGVVYFRAGTNTGTVTLGAVGSTGGLVLNSGDWSPPIGPIARLETLTYQFSNGSGDTLQMLILA